MSLAPGTTLGPYEIVSQLGSGGMGVVYEARDPRLKRTVAIKLLPPDLTRDDTAKQRFLQEAQAASALDHPNICTIYEINETDNGQLYLVMAHYEGETLKERIERGPLELDDAIDMATQVGQGLAEAHGAGIVHRDIKPANLLVTKTGVVKILDFGLAKLAGSEGVTQTGTTVGTVAYMSPEQARGQEVDHRTDIWSLGVVLYEMLAGTPPFQGENLLSISNAILEQEQSSLTGSSSAAQGIVTRALGKDRATRYQAVTDLLGALQGLRSQPDAPTIVASAPPDVPSIAVLPLVDMSPEKDQEYFCDGLAEELIDALARLKGLRVVGRTSSFQFRGKGHDLRKIGEELGAKTVLEGSVRKAGKRLRINAQLINASDGYHIWSERYDRTMDDVFEVQDEIAKAVVEKLEVELLGVAGEPLVQPQTNNLEAHELCLKGRHHQSRFTRAGFEKAVECFTQALAIEPDYPQAHAGVAYVHVVGTILSRTRPHDVMPKARESANKAIEIDDEVADAHLALATVAAWYDWNWDQAEREYRRTLELNPIDTYARGNFALLLSQVGRAEDAVAEARHAVALDPLSVSGRQDLSTVLFMVRQFEEAIAEARAGIELDATYQALYWSMGWALGGQGKLDDAVETLRQAEALVPGDPLSQAFLGRAVGLAGRHDEALSILESLEYRRRENYVAGLNLAMVNIGLGNTDRAIAWLEEAADDRDPMMTYVNQSQLFDPLRSDPRFQALLRRMNFPHPESNDAVLRDESATGPTSEPTVNADASPAAVSLRSESDTPSIAVLPFVNMSADPEQEYFCDGLAEELIDALARIEGLRVVARTSAFQFRGKGLDLTDVSKKLKVKTILEGSVRKAGNRLRINTQLINAADGYHLWSERYDRELEDVFEVQEDIARTVVKKLEVELLGSAVGPLVRRGTDDVEAHDLCVKGRSHFWRLTAEELDAGLRCFEQALERDPGCAQAHAGAALTYGGRATLGLGSEEESNLKAKAAARKAIAIDDGVRDAHYVLAMAHQFDWNWSDAEHEFRRELDVNPGNAEARSLFSIFLLGLGHTDEAVREARRAVEHDPLADMAHHMLANVLLGLDRIEEAIASSRRGVQVAGGFTHARWSLGIGLSLTQQHDEALSVLRKNLSLSDGEVTTLALLGWACGRAGLSREATDIARQLEEGYGDSAGDGAAMVHVALNDYDEAFRWLSQAFDRRGGFIAFLPAWVVWDPLRSDPRFQALLQRINFPSAASPDAPTGA